MASIIPSYSGRGIPPEIYFGSPLIFYLVYSMFLTLIFYSTPSKTKPATMYNSFKLAVSNAESGIS